MAVHPIMLATFKNKTYLGEVIIEIEKSAFNKHQKEEECNGPKTPPVSTIEYELYRYQQKKRKIMKNLVVLSLIFLLIFTAFNGLLQLQSSLHEELGMGVITQSIMNAFFILSCLFLPNLSIVKLGHRTTIVIAISGCMIWMAANGYAVWGTMVTASVVVGLAQGLLWPTQASYVMVLGRAMAAISGQEEDHVVSRFFGIFYFIYSICGVFGAVVSSTILQLGHEVTGFNMSFDQRGRCGARHCPWSSMNDTRLSRQQPSSTVIWTLIGVYLGLTLIATLLVPLGLDNIDSYKKDKPKEVYNMDTLKKLTLATFSQMKDIKQILLIPLSMTPGFSSALLSAEWTKSYVTCSSGIWMVGWVGIPYGVTSVIMSYVSGSIVKYAGRAAMLTFCFVFNIAIYIALLLWYPHSDQEAILYVLSALAGLAKAPWYPQISALYANTFKENTDGAFANFTLWMSLGSTIAFAYSNFLCTDIKIYICIGISILGMLGYGGLLVLIRREKQKQPQAV